MTTSQHGLEDFEQIGRYVTATICELNPDYAELGSNLIEDVVATNVQNARIYVGAVLRQARPGPDEVRVLADAARRRVHQGIRLEAMLRAYRIGARAMWEKLSEHRPDLDHRMLTDWTLRYIDWVSSEAERAYLEERDSMLNSRLETTKLLVARIVEDDFESEIDRAAALTTLGLTPDQPHAAVVAGPGARGDGGALDGPLSDFLTEMRRTVPSSVSALLRRGGVVLVPAAATSGLRAMVETALRKATATGPGLVSAGIGRPVPAGTGLAGTVREAERARALGEILFPSEIAHEYESMSFYDLFQQGEVVDSFVEAVLGAYLGASRNDRLDLVRTLYVYFTLGMNRKAAARRLGIHPNTLDYRLRQATSIGEVDLTSAENAFRFQLAVRLLPICTTGGWLAEGANVWGLVAE